MSEYKKLSNQPLRLVLAEFRFSQIMQISEYIPKLQEVLRKKYPIPDRKSEQAIHVQPGGIAVSAIDSWSFISANKKNAIDINQDRLVYFTAEYPRFDGFSQACKEALEALSTIVEPTLIQRIGLRYCDLIKVDDSEHISDLVASFFTFPKCVESLGTAKHQRSEIFVSTDMGNLAIRTLYGNHNLTCLPDVQGLPVVIEKDEVASERIILDFDHFWEPKDESVSFEINDILEKLSLLHETSREAFWKVTTDHARNDKWA